VRAGIASYLIRVVSAGLQAVAAKNGNLTTWVHAVGSAVRESTRGDNLAVGQQASADDSSPPATIDGDKPFWASSNLGPNRLVTGITYAGSILMWRAASKGQMKFHWTARAGDRPQPAHCPPAGSGA
jgi:hypothetical protein